MAWRTLLGTALLAAIAHGMLPGAGAAPHEYTAEEIERLKGKTVTNLDEVLRSIGFTDVESDPYPPLWYDTVIDRSLNCYVVFPSAQERSTYEIKSLRPEEAAALATDGEPRHFLSHYGPCGACSQLDDLAVYIGTRDLTSAVRSCTLKMIKPWTLSCLEALGFTRECRWIWYWNTQNTKKLAPQGGCFGVCVANIFTPNNVPVGTYNPCQPPPEMMDENSQLQALQSSEPQVVSGGQLCLPSCGWCKGCCMPAKAREDGGLCRNTINGQPACEPQQWQNGEYRLNACLQCDECRSGPIFQKIAGRTRRGSGIISAIGRPGVVEIVHTYG